MARAMSTTQLLKTEFKVMQWSQKWVDAFGRPETTGVWFACGQSTNGKTSFMLELAKELGRLQMGKVFYNSLEEGARKTMKDALIRAGIGSSKDNVLVGCESIDELDVRLSKRKSAHVVIIDSIQLTGVRTARLLKFNEKYKHKLIIYVSQALGTAPRGNVAKDIRFIAGQKYWVEGFKAISQGREKSGGIYTIWEEGANNYWGAKEKLQEQK
jgi:hypothetical protein